MHPVRALLLAGGAAAVAVGLIVMVWDEPADVAGGGAPAAGAPQFSAREVLRIRLERPKESVELVRLGGRWQIVKPRRLEADSTAVRALLRRCAGLRPTRVVGPARDLPGFGLAPPRVRIVLRLRGGRTHSIDLGRPEPFAGGAFARLNPKAPVVVIAAEAAAALDRNVEDLRQRRLFRVSLRRASRFRVDLAGAHVELRRIGLGQWAVGGAAPAEAVEVRTFLALLSELRAERYLAEGKVDLATFGLDQPDATVTLFLENRQVVLLLDRQANGRVAATVSGSGVIAEIPEAAWRSVTRAAGGWHSSRALHFPRAQVGGLRISRQGTLVVLSRSRTGAWEMLTPRARPASQQAVRKLLDNLEKLRTRGGSASAAALGALGLAPPMAEILLEDRRGRLLDGLRLGRTRNGLRAARSVRWPRPFWVPTPAAKALTLSAKDFQIPQHTSQKKKAPVRSP